MNDIPVQYYQSVIAIQLAVTGALLWNVRYFDRRDANRPTGSKSPNPWLLLVVAAILSATLFGCLYAIRHGSQQPAASAVTIGLALSILPIVVRVLPPMREIGDIHRRPHAPAAVLGLAIYVALVAGIVVGLSG